MLIYQEGTALLRRSRVNSHFQALTWEQQGKGSSKHLLASPKQPKTGLFMGYTAAGKGSPMFPVSIVSGLAVLPV